MPRTVARIAAAVVALEAVGVLALAGWQIVALVGHDTTSAVSAIALIVLTVVGAAAIAAFAAATWAGRSWGRSGGIVTQLLVLAVAGGALTGAYPHLGTALALGVPALVALVLLFLAAREANRAEGRGALAAGDRHPEG
ncbi:histidine kinase [Microbacterium marinilacus]|uniref:Histidine kinase n=1 Tax=Microbacterium marinilacus TaxID=415209 RepID=A0ABP7B8G9_9MICO|nr:histidine kinase [Microbacterium marinilacus]MBY0687255.1 histidine kinase [Microbacterium marinilacus]